MIRPLQTPPRPTLTVNAERVERVVLRARDPQDLAHKIGHALGVDDVLGEAVDVKHAGRVGHLLHKRRQLGVFQHGIRGGVELKEVLGRELLQGGGHGHRVLLVEVGRVGQLVDVARGEVGLDVRLLPVELGVEVGQRFLDDAGGRDVEQLAAKEKGEGGRLA